MKYVDHQSHQSGAGLVDVLVALGLLGIIGIISIQYYRNVLNIRTAIELTRVRSLLQTTLLTSTSCSKVSPCSENELKELRDIDDNLLVSANGTSTYGLWQVRARCQPDRSLEVRVASHKDGAFRRHPVTGQPMDWQSTSSILIEAGVLCRDLTKSNELSVDGHAKALTADQIRL